MVTKYIGCLSLLLFVTIVVANDVNRARIYNRQLLKTSQTIITDTQATDLYFSQTLDHFVPLNSQETFPQRYYVNNSFWKENGPAFLIIGGEGELRSSSVIKGEIVELAQKYGAILFALEHRFYGESSPFDTLDSDTLPYLTTQQALSDLVNFRSSMVTAYNISETTKWAIFGCSYSGALSAWFRLKFPNLAVASFSGSSPVEAILSFYHYDQVISTSLGSECAAPIRNATLQIQQLLLDPTTNTQIKTRLQCESIDDNVAVLYAIADAIAYVVQYNFNIQQVCTNFTTSENVVDTYVDFLNFFYTSTGTSCYDLDIAGFTNQTYNPARNMRQWMWQSCDELGYFQTAPAENSLRSTLIDANWHIQVCKTLFGNSLMGPKIDWTNEYYGAKELITSNTIFTNGQLDPWQVLSVTSSLSPSVPSILVADVAHCANWYAPSPSDPQGLVDSRSQVSSYLGAFLNSCDGGCGDQGVCTFTRKGNDVSSKCACINGKSGHHCSQEAIPWWSLLILGVGVFVLSLIIGVFVGMKFCRSRNYTSI